MPAAGHLDHLTDSDLVLLAELGGARGAAGELRAHPEHVVALLADPRVYDALLRPAPGREPLTATSAFLVFACLVERAACELRSTSSVAEPVAGRKVPVFDAQELREFVAPAARRLFLAELLASYTRVASGAVWVRQRRRWRRRRFSELDLGQLMRMLEVVPAAERPGVYRRLGDLALFLAGVFPDACDRPLGATTRAGTHVGLGDLERLGARWYRAACATAASSTAALAVVGDVADQFTRARRVLNFITERHLFATRDQWFSPPA